MLDDSAKQYEWDNAKCKAIIATTFIVKNQDRVQERILHDHLNDLEYDPYKLKSSNYLRNRLKKSTLELNCVSGCRKNEKA